MLCAIKNLLSELKQDLVSGEARDCAPERHPASGGPGRGAAPQSAVRPHGQREQSVRGAQVSAQLILSIVFVSDVML